MNAAACMVRSDDRPPGAAAAEPAGPAECALTRRTGLQLPVEMSIEEWRRVGLQIQSVSDSSSWWLGDWLVYGQAHFPDRYRHAVDATQLDYQTLRNYAWVARRYAIARRRHELSFQHHAELTGLVDHEQDRWMDLAIRFGWSRTELRRRLRAGRLPGCPEAATRRADTLRLKIIVQRDRQQRWTHAAASVQQDLARWIVETLDEAAGATCAAPGEPVPLAMSPA